MPIANGFTTRSISCCIGAYSTQVQEFFFYFPTAGSFKHFGSCASLNGKTLGQATFAQLKVQSNREGLAFSRALRTNPC